MLLRDMYQTQVGDQTTPLKDYKWTRLASNRHVANPNKNGAARIGTGPSHLSAPELMVYAL